MHLGGVVALLFTPMMPWLRVFLLIAVGASLVRTLGMHALRNHPTAVTRFEFNDQGECMVAGEGFARRRCRLVARFVHPWIVVLRLAPEDARLPLNLVIARDAVALAPFRALRARLNLLRPSAAEMR